MLGYVRCDRGEMKVKHYALYRALYCGLCHSIKKNTTVFLQPFLSYDFVFLAALRMYALGVPAESEKMRCLIHPFSQKMRIRDNPALRFTSVASLILTEEKLRDDLLDGDVSFFRRLASRLVLPFLSRSRKRLQQEESISDLAENLRSLLRKGREAERRGADLDEMCTSFAKVISLLASHGARGETERLLSSIGDCLGRMIYTMDAMDDWERDEKSGAFNPLFKRFGSKKEALGSLPEIDLVLSFYVREMKLSFDLLEGDSDLGAICENIICGGLPKETAKLFQTIGENQ